MSSTLCFASHAPLRAGRTLSRRARTRLSRRTLCAPRATMARRADPAPQTGAAAPAGPAGLSALRFEDTFVASQPADYEPRNYVRRVSDAAYSLVAPTDPSEDDARVRWRLAEPEEEAAAAPLLSKGMVAWSGDAAKLLGLSGEEPEGDEMESAVDVLGGFGPMWMGMKPYAACYSGHQFGSFAGTLGDGRAMTLGEVVNDQGERWEVQLKGAGKTPYSRRADGRAVLRSSIREFLASEAMHALGVPTTRALSLVATGSGVIRDMFYSGDLKMENGAVCSRMAPSFLRVGSFENPAVAGDVERLKSLADYAIEHHFPELLEVGEEIEEDGRNRYGELLAESARLNAEMVAMWQGVGFVHGVGNTDNTSLLGLTIDYGPYGFLDEYDPNYTPNTTDLPGRRYRYGAQPDFIHWNLHKLAVSLAPLCGVNDAQSVVHSYGRLYAAARSRVFARKLGLSEMTPDDDKLLDELLELMEAAGTDFTNTWRALSGVVSTSSDEDLRAVYEPLIDGKDGADEGDWEDWFSRYHARVCEDGGLSDKARVKVMNKANPVYILRNYMAQEAIDAANEGDYSVVRALYAMLRNPFEEQDGCERYTEKPPSWAKRAGVCVNSCSS